MAARQPGNLERKSAQAGLIIAQAEAEADLAAVYQMRRKVFCEEQGFPELTDSDGFDQGSIHLLGKVNGLPAACGRIRISGKNAKLERIVVLPEYRGQGYGDEMLEKMLDIARAAGCETAKLAGQARLLRYYLKHGFEIEGEMFQIDGVNHYWFVRYEPCEAV